MSKHIKRMGAQGDLMMIRVAEIPSDAREEPCGRSVVVAHSETGHHHVLELRDGFEARLFRAADPFTAFLRLEGDGDSAADVVHHRSFDTHGTITVGPGIWMMRNQVEYTPAGWRKATD